MYRSDLRVPKVTKLNFPWLLVLGRHHVRPVVLPPKLVPPVPEPGSAIAASLLRTARIVLIVEDEAEVLVIENTPGRFC